MKVKKRLDVLLTERNLADSRSKAQAVIMSGLVYVDGQKADKPGVSYEETVDIEVRGAACPYVSRGGLKLEKALRDFGVKPEGYVCSDSGASTGGFTDCLLKRGAASVLSVDVGYAQFDWSLREDPRVDLRERTNMVDLPDDDNRSTIDLAVCDVSFTSVKTVLPAVVELLRGNGRFLTLVKPQFEAARDEVGEGGVVSDPAVHLRALEDVALAFESRGLGVLGACQSPIHGHKGNVEFLLLGQRGSRADRALDYRSVVADGAVELAGAL